MPSRILRRPACWATLLALGACLLTTLGCAANYPRASKDGSLPGEPSPVLVGQVVKVVDGDTLVVQLDTGPLRVRLYAVDAPEKSQPHGKEASAALSRLAAGKQVSIKPFEQDRYNRLIGILYVDDVNVNSQLIRQGHAWAYRRYMRKADAKLCSLEADARRNKRGLWAQSISKVMAPWEWRNKKRTSTTNYSGETANACVTAIGRSVRARSGA